MSNPSAQIYQTPLTEASTVQKEVLGSLRWHKNKCYKYVQYKEAAAAVDGVVGEVVYQYAPGGAHAGDADKFKVTSDLTDSNEVGAGVLQAAMAEGQYGWIQIKGPAVLALALTAGADGDPLTPTGSADGTLDVSALVTDHVCAHALDASAKLVLLDCPF